MGVNVIPLKMSVLDCGPRAQDRKAFEYTVRMKVAAFKQMLESRFMPVKSHDDGRMILRVPEHLKDTAPTEFVQFHVRQEGEEWAAVCYPVDTAEGRPMMTLEEQMAAFPDSSVAEVIANISEDGDVAFSIKNNKNCDCPACTLRRAFEKMGDELEQEMKQEEPAKPDEKRTLH